MAYSDVQLTLIFKIIFWALVPFEFVSPGVRHGIAETVLLAVGNVSGCELQFPARHVPGR
jgi:hypothetical protein